MNDLNATGSDPLTDRISEQFTTVKALHLGFLQGFMESPWATLLIMGTILFALGVATRYAIFTVIRMSGRSKMERNTHSLEAMCMWVSLAVGFVVGEVLFQNVWLGGLTGGLFVVLCTGAVLEALVANDKANKGRRPMPTVRTGYVPTAADTSAPRLSAEPASAPAPRQ